MTRLLRAVALGALLLGATPPLAHEGEIPGVPHPHDDDADEGWGHDLLDAALGGGGILAGFLVAAALYRRGRKGR